MIHCQYKNNTVNTEGKPGTGKNKKKNKANIEAKELQQLAFQTSSKKAKNKSKSKEGTPKPSSKEEAQYEEWREKDEKVSITHIDLYAFYLINRTSKFAF